MGSHGRQLTFNPSTPTSKGRHTTHPLLSTRRGLSHTARRRPFSMHGTATTASPFVQKTATSPPSSHHGADTATKPPPQGYIASGDGYTRRYDEIVAEIPNKTKCVDDALLWADTLEESFHQAVQWLDICGRHGIILNPEKFVLGSDVVEFAGFEITPDRIRPSRNPGQHHRYTILVRLINHVSFAFSMADKMLPFRELLKPVRPSNGMTI
ncbi:hypothetical protein RRG08_064434 [Elysia crispata]|uniref:Reverse transcriptase domain-containing protein n=1 Tax=Elysia crispata TaxID=231223 RepID=A0AAE0YYR6_9GAST|nr:hypothetical protein RRG08_064434 [Elysia crispata]